MTAESLRARDAAIWCATSSSRSGGVMSGGEAQASWARKLGLEPDTQTCRSRHHGRHTFATEALAAGVSIFELARLMGTSVKVIDRTYGHWRSTPRT